jgi:hypothetical protein
MYEHIRPHVFYFNSRQYYRDQLRHVGFEALTALVMKSMSSSEMSVDFQPTTRRYIPKDRSLQLRLRHEAQYKD